MNELFLIDVGYACFGIETIDRICTLAPPIANWMRGRTSKEIAAWVKGKGGTVVKCVEPKLLRGQFN